MKREQHLIIAIPSLNDWAAIAKLLLLIDEVNLEKGKISTEVLIIDDCSSESIPDFLVHQWYRQIQAVNILRLRRNLGHQRAIAIGLCYIYEHLKCDLVIVMDGDGEDNPFEIERLIRVFQANDHQKIVFARRSKRSESRTFKFFYFIYQKLYQLLTGKTLAVGNFSLLPYSLLKNVVVVSEIWNHYSSALHRSRLPYVEVNIPRTKRLDGHPKMNLVSLITHGLSSIAVYGDIVGTRILLTITVLLLSLILASIIVIGIRFLTDLAIPGWATYVMGLLIITACQLILIGTIFSLMILASRNSQNIIPIRDYHFYIDHKRPVTRDKSSLSF